MEAYQRIRDLREDAEKKQIDIAELLKTTQHQYSKYERNVQEIPMRHLITLAKFYDVSLDYICGLTNQKKSLYEQGSPNTSKRLENRIDN